MRIAITSDPMLPVPPLEYGGIERVIHMLVTGLVERGHEVSLFARRGSRVPCRLVPYPGDDVASVWDNLRNAASVSRLLIDRPHVIHSFGRLAYLTATLPTRIPKIMSYQRVPTIARIRRAISAARASTLTFTACSAHLARRIEPVAPVVVIYNGVPLRTFTPAYDIAPDAPLLFLGRLERIKGVHTAIQAALAAGRRLIIAGNVVDTPGGRAYFETEVVPHLGDAGVEYVGPVDDNRKNRLLGEAAALLMPVEWDEPFGIVMAEALACGTPVIGLRRGAVPEVVEHGVSGFVCDTTGEMAAAVGRLPEIDRRTCRARCASRFGDDVIVDAYEQLYRERAGAV